MDNPGGISRTSLRDHPIEEGGLVNPGARGLPLSIFVPRVLCSRLLGRAASSRARHIPGDTTSVSPGLTLLLNRT